MRKTDWSSSDPEKWRSLMMSIPEQNPMVSWMMDAASFTEKYGLFKKEHMVMPSLEPIYNPNPNTPKMEVFMMSDSLSDMKDKLRTAEQMYGEAMRALENSSKVAHRQQREIEGLNQRVWQSADPEPTRVPTATLSEIGYEDDGLCEDCHGWNIFIMSVGTRYRARMRLCSDPSVKFFLMAEDPTKENTKALVIKFMNKVVLPTEHLVYAMARDIQRQLAIDMGIKPRSK